MEVVKNGYNVFGMFDVYDVQKNIFRVYCDLNFEVGYVWMLIQFYLFVNNYQFKRSGFSVDCFVNEEGSIINWNVYCLFLVYMKLIVDVLIYFRVICNFLVDGFVYIDYVCVKLEGYDLFGVWIVKCCIYEFINIWNIICQGCIVGIW